MTVARHARPLNEASVTARRSWRPSTRRAGYLITRFIGDIALARRLASYGRSLWTSIDPCSRFAPASPVRRRWLYGSP
jgi:hypothetical protein